MTDIPYATVISKIPVFFKKIKGVGVPPNVTSKWMTSIGFTTENEKRIIGVLMALGFIDKDGVPQDCWKAYRNDEQSRSIMAISIKNAYPGLFSIYPDAYRKDEEALKNYFKTQTGLGTKAVTLMVSTFKELVKLADFQDIPEITSFEEKIPLAPVNNILLQDDRLLAEKTESGVINLTVNIQLQIPPTNDADIYEKFFEALERHILHRKN